MAANASVRPSKEECAMSDSQDPAMTPDPALAAAAVAAAGDAIVTTDSHGLITSWNRAAEVLLGVLAGQAVGQSLAVILPEPYRARHATCFRAAMSSGLLAHGGEPARVEATTPGGGVMPLALTLGLIEGADGAPSGVVAVLRPVEESLVSFVNP
jgi:PAS domain S-box-containing protein